MGGMDMLPRISRKAAVFLGKAAGALIFTVIGGAVALLLDKERKSILNEAERVAGEQETELPLEVEASPETEGDTGPEADDEA